jgi:hypothetical protein
MSARHSHKRQRPGNAARAADDARLKLHLRLVPIGRTLYRVVTLRPGTEAAFSTNYFHNTWHLLSDAHGAGLLARLLWGLSYQRQPGTLVALFGEHLRPTPFDADPSPPILLAPAHLTPLDHQNFRVQKSRLRRASPPQQTVRWQTFGMDAGAGDLEEPFDVEMARHADLNRLWTTWLRAPHGPWQRERVSLCGGWVCYAAPPPVLRLQALVLRRMARANRSPMDYHYLAERRKADGCFGRYGYPPGEVQIFPDYRQQLKDAQVARREALARIARNGTESSDLASPETLRERVWAQRAAVVERRRRACLSRRRSDTSR